MTEAVKRSPFKFLDAYGKEDRDIFFGRELEIEALYQMTFQTNLILVYGMSGTGKTSLIQCGLANCFDPADWYDIFIRRQDNINRSFERELDARDRDESFETGFSIPQKVKSLYLDYLRPIYLIFDQFEELFILGSEAEQEMFIRSVRQLLDADLPCKILIVIREEYLAHLSGFEKVVPSLFDKRLRVEPMNRANARGVITGTVQNKDFGINMASTAVADRIIDNVTEGIGRVQLTYLQVFLDKMYLTATEDEAGRKVFNLDLVRKVGRIDDVLEAFLDEQLDVFAEELGEKEQALKWLKHFVSEKGTKVPVNRREVAEAMPELNEQRNAAFLSFFVNRRILRPLDNDQYELTHDSIAQKLFRTKAAGVRMPAKLPDYELPANPFLRFRAYNKEMAAVFYGRDEEIQELFDLIVNETGSRTTLVYGPVGVGKTSLIRAGLQPRLGQLMPAQVVRMSRELLGNALIQQMLTAEPDEDYPPLLLEIAFQWERTQPTREERKVIILDQFEELYIWVGEFDQLRHFYEHLAYLVDGRWNCDLVLVVRDEFFSQVPDMERLIPNIMEEQIRVRHIAPEEAVVILEKMMKAADWEIDSPEVLQRIVRNVSEGDGKVNLTYLQLYMDKLYQAATE